MKALVLSLLLTVSTFTAAMAEQALTLKGGLSLWNDTSNSDELESGTEAGYTVGLSYDVVREGLRLELEGRHTIESLHGANPGGVRGHSLDGDYLHITTLMGSVWSQPVTYENFTPYFGGGVGAGMLTALGDVAVVPAWQVGGGMLFSFTNTLDLDLGYRWFNIFSAKLDGLESQYDSHTFLAGIRIKF